MGSLNSTGLARLNAATLSLHAAEKANDLPSALLQALSILVPGDIHSVSFIGFQGTPFSHVINPPGGIPATVEDALFRTLRENPSYGRRQKAGTVSDFISRTQWHRTAHYAEGFRKIGQEDGLGLDLQLDGGVTLGLNASRSTSNFSKAERLSLNMLAPHIQLVSRKLVAQSHGPAGWALLNLEKMRLRDPLAPTVRLLFNRWFGTFGPGNALPADLKNWLRAISLLNSPRERGPVFIPKPFRRHGPKGTLELLFSPSSVRSGDPFLLIREMESQAKMNNRLTAREREILLLLVQELSNAEIAERIGTRPGTVKRHLENLYAKMGVRNRYQAVTAAKGYI